MYQSQTTRTVNRRSVEGAVVPPVKWTFLEWEVISRSRPLNELIRFNFKQAEHLRANICYVISILSSYRCLAAFKRLHILAFRVLIGFAAWGKSCILGCVQSHRGSISTSNMALGEPQHRFVSLSCNSRPAIDQVFYGTMNCIPFVFSR